MINRKTYYICTNNIKSDKAIEVYLSLTSNKKEKTMPRSIKDLKEMGYLE